MCDSRQHGVRRFAPFSAGVVAALLPKCPVCLAAYAGFAGLGLALPQWLGSAWFAAFFIAFLFAAATVAVAGGGSAGPAAGLMGATVMILGRVFDFPTAGTIAGLVILGAGVAISQKREHVRRTKTD